MKKFLAMLMAVAMVAAMWAMPAMAKKRDLDAEIRKAEADAWRKYEKWEKKQEKKRKSGKSGSKSGKSGSKSGKKKREEYAEIEMEPIQPFTDGEFFEGDTLDDDGRPIHGVWKETSPGKWDLIHWYYTDMD